MKKHLRKDSILQRLQTQNFHCLILHLMILNLQKLMMMTLDQRNFFSIFDPKTVFVFNAKNVKTATKTRSRKNQLRDSKSIISIDKFSAKSQDN